MESNEPQVKKQHNDTTYINIIFFFLMLFFGALGSSFEMYSYWQNICWEMANASFITGCVLSSVQLADKKWIIPSAGFVLMSIAFIGFFTLIPCDTYEKIQEVAKNVILILPSMLMISSYKQFPLWVRLLGFVACVPFFLILILAKAGVEKETFTMILGIGYFLIENTAVFWGIYFLKIFRRERNQKSLIQ